MVANKWGIEAVAHYMSNDTSLLRWEENYDAHETFVSLNKYQHIPYIFGILVYLPVLYFGQKIMANREPFKLRGPLILWNMGLAIFSLICLVRMAPESWNILNKFGFYHSVCNNSYYYYKPAGFWGEIFIYSKLFELVDTLFLVLKKQKLIFLHVYHHASVLIFTWTVAANGTAVYRWFATMNVAIHTMMYTYYALKAFPHLFRIPKSLSMTITMLQTLQMVMGTTTTATAFYNYSTGEKCSINTPVALFALVIYSSYLILFSHFFYKSYCSPRPQATSQPAKKIA